MEKFYIVTEKSPVYKQFKDYRENRKLVNDHYGSFKENHGIEATEYNVDNESIYIVPTNNDIVKFEKVLKQPLSNGLMGFKKNSKVGKDWVSSLKETGLKILHRPMLGFVFRVHGTHRTRLFEHKGWVYCSCDCDCGDWETPEGMQEIKASEFYKVIEESA